MTPGVSLHRRVIAVVMLAAIVAVALIALWPRTGATPSGATPPGHDHGTVTATPASALTETGTPLDPPPTSEDAIGSAPETTLAAAGATAAERRDTDALGGGRGDVAPEDVLASDSGELGGCLTAYGSAGQCLTVVPPSQSAHVQAMVDAGIDPSTMSHDWSCAELRTYFPTGIAVREPGVDPAHLDTDGDGVACGPND